MSNITANIGDFGNPKHNLVTRIQSSERESFWNRLAPRDLKTASFAEIKKGLHAKPFIDSKVFHFNNSALSKNIRKARKPFVKEFATSISDLLKTLKGMTRSNRGPLTRPIKDSEMQSLIKNLKIISWIDNKKDEEEGKDSNYLVDLVRFIMHETNRGKYVAHSARLELLSNWINELSTKLNKKSQQ